MKTTRERAEETIGRQSTRVMEKVAQDSRSASMRIAAKRASEAAAHADAMKAAGEARGEKHEIIGHGTLSQPPEYHFQLMSLALRRSPIVGMNGRVVSDGSLSFRDGSKAGLPTVENVGTRFAEKIVFTA